MLKKRLTAFLIAFCMMLSLLPDVGWALDITVNPIDKKKYYNVSSPVNVDGLRISSNDGKLVINGDMLERNTDLISQASESTDNSGDLEYTSNKLTLTSTKNITITGTNTGVATIEINPKASGTKVTLNNSGNAVGVEITGSSVVELQQNAAVKSVTVSGVSSGGNTTTYPDVTLTNNATIESLEVNAKNFTLSGSGTISDKLTISNITETATIGGNKVKNVEITAPVRPSSTDHAVAVPLNKVTLNNNLQIEEEVKISNTIAVTLDHLKIPTVNVTKSNEDITLDTVELTGHGIGTYEAGNNAQLLNALNEAKAGLIIGAADATKDGEAEVRITLPAGTTSKITGGPTKAGVECTGENSVKFIGRGTLQATGGYGIKDAYSYGGGAGIGGSRTQTPGKISIWGECWVTAVGHDGGAGIGYGADVNSSATPVENFLHLNDEKTSFTPVVEASGEIGDISDYLPGAGIGKNGTTGKMGDPLPIAGGVGFTFAKTITKDKKTTMVGRMYPDTQNNVLELYRELKFPGNLTILPEQTLNLSGESTAYNTRGSLNLNGYALIIENKGVLQLSDTREGTFNTNGTFILDNIDSVKVKNPDTTSTENYIPYDMALNRGSSKAVYYAKYSIPFHLNGGKYEISSGITDKDETNKDDIVFSLPAEVKEKFEISGTNYDIKADDVLGATVDGEKVRVYTDDLTVWEKAIWEVDGDDIPGEEDLKHPDNEEDDFSKHKEFSGWYTDKTGGTLMLPDPDNVSNSGEKKYSLDAKGALELHTKGAWAIWDSDVVTVTLNANGGKLEWLNGKDPAPGNTISIPDSGEQLGSVTLNSDGSATVVLKLKDVVENEKPVEDENGKILRATTAFKIGEYFDIKRDGYNFVRWDGPESSAYSQDSEIKVSKDTTLTANWSAGYTVVLDANGGLFDSNNKPQATGYTDTSGYMRDTNIASFEKPKWDLHSFVDWYKIPVDKDDVTKSRLSQGENAPAYDNAALSNAKAELALDNSFNKTNVDREQNVVYAMWHEGYGVTINLMGGNYDGKPEAPDFYTNKELELNLKDTSTDGLDYEKIKKDGYEIQGWYLDEEYTQEIKRESNNTLKLTGYFKDLTEKKLTIYVRWQKKAGVIIKFDLGGVSDATLTPNITSITFEQGTYSLDDSNANAKENNKAEQNYPQVSSPTRKFLGWYTVQDSQDPKDLLRVDSLFYDDTTVYAVWGPPYQITYDAGIGRFADNKTTVTADTDENGMFLPDAVAPPTSPLASFKGWQIKNENGQLEDIPDGYVFHAPDTVYAKWGPPYYIEYVGKDESFTLSSSTQYWTDDKGALPTPLPEPIPKEEGALFDGWFLDKEYTKPVKEGDIMEEAPVMLYPKWAVTYTITLDASPGNFLNDSSTKDVKTDRDGKIQNFGNLEKPVRPQSKFVGWFLKDQHGNLTEQVTENTVFDFTTTIYAKWEKTPPYTITFDANNRKWGEDAQKTPEKANAEYENEKNEVLKWGAVFPNTNKEKLELMTDDYAVLKELPIEPVSRNQGFLGWYTLPVDGVRVEFRKDEKTGKITAYEYSDSSDPNKSKVREFKDDTTFYAHWSSDEFSITLDFNVSAIEDAPPELKLTRRAETVNQSLVYLPRVAFSDQESGNFMWVMDTGTSKNGTGWYSEREKDKGFEIKAINPFDNGKSDPTVFKNGTTIYAHWIPLKEEETPPKFEYASVWFYLDNDFEKLPYMIVMTETSGKLFVVPTPVDYKTTNPDHAGQQFGGWYYKDANGEEQRITEDTRFTENVNAYAKWDDTYTIKFDPNGGRVSPDEMKTVNNMLKDLPVPEYKDKDGNDYEFLGWFTGDNASDVYGKQVFSVKQEENDTDYKIKATVFDKDTTVYARWKGLDSEQPGGDDDKDKVFTIFFDANGGTVSKEKDTTDKEGRLTSLPTPVRDGYNFDGWFTAASGGSKVSISTVFEKDSTIFAHWTDSNINTTPPFTITFDPAGGRVAIASDVTDANGRLYSLPAAQRTGYVLDGWYLGSTQVNSSYTFSSDVTLTAHWKTETIGGGNSSSDDTYAISIDTSEGGVVTTPLTYAAEGSTVTLNVRPNAGYQLDELEVTNSRGRDISVRSLGGNRYSFVMPASRVYVSATFYGQSNAVIPSGSIPSGTTPSGTYPSGTGNNGTNSSSSIGSTGTTGANSVFSQPVLNTMPLPFLDVRPSDWYYTSVDYLWRRDLMSGVTATQFGPQSTTSNAMIWTVLARLAGVDVTAGGGVWYQQAQSWAVSRGISDGTDPNSPVTREQLASMLWRYSGSPSASYDLGQFADRASISTYQAENALRWAVASGIVNGNANGSLNPRGTATRAEVAVMLTRFCQR